MFQRLLLSLDPFISLTRAKYKKKRKITEEMKPLLIISDLDNSDESTSGTDTGTEE